MMDRDWLAFLQWALPQLHLRFRGFRRVRKQVIKRVRRRLVWLGLPDAAAYRAYLERTPEEWAVLDALCRVSISRFRRDRAVFDLLRDEALPRLATRFEKVSAWSAGCASGEEPYSLALSWLLDLDAPVQRIEILASDADDGLLERARRAEYAAGTLKEIPSHWFEAFERAGDLYRLKPRHREPVRFVLGDVRAAPPNGDFGLIACRNLAFTYFEEAVQCQVLDALTERLAPGGYLLIGGHEQLPQAEGRYDAVRPGLPLFVKR